MADDIIIKYCKVLNALLANVKELRQDKDDMCAVDNYARKEALFKLHQAAVHWLKLNGEDI